MVKILGIKLNTEPKTEILNRIRSWLSSPRQHYIVTPNPEIVLLAQKDEEYFYILNHADISLPDGIGLKFAALTLGKNIPRITGSDLTQDILIMAQESQDPILIINWEKGLSSANDISVALENIYPRLQFEIWDVDRAEALKPDWKPRATIAKIMFAALGAPYQEKFIFHQLAKIPTVKVALGIGGSFDFLTHKIKRAPKLMRRLGLEWLYRVISQPINRKKRLKRIYNATCVFVVKVINWRFILPFKYRPNVACLLYKIENNQSQILLVERTEEPGHFQLPQGGTDGLSLKAAAIKELGEELNSGKFTVKAVFQNLYRYKIDPKKNGYNRAAGYQGQKQGLVIAEFNGQDSDIRINFWDHSSYKWVPADKLIDESHPVRREGYKIYLKKLKSII
ncbi:hypothetical protein COX67_02640 [Candidatus Falkowbacteria bacterium CG_4_10_14_0_2_um_filter_36_22]|uniref:Nudix hydrolase domain-containing protein n=2 Tax=Candidatus Falkowiibacteriota TaxID=1752728 RepID=A0A1J4TC79_9BACT|nr:MAG: hypothetical protein AUJ35_00095 [Candidatus Falkowbacteria bacterium CG1_02_41_21]PIZ11211.1 MAG: hypothetical protein COY54_00640 [Candidatus Falkowbacteria bacterium CG_4_10_14_0_8_um_filter_41_36]PJA10895.1 MAG: hypothetical protein COX67_02640 [Candidatus Falkowbacteria bacterium CG_4_10_14_0_2_um_filter_36_22]